MEQARFRAPFPSAPDSLEGGTTHVFAPYLACALAAGVAIGIALADCLLGRELRRIARYLRERDPHSNGRIVLRTTAPGLPELAASVNSLLDAQQNERIAARDRQQEEQRSMSALSHDIRTPLMGARGYLQLAADEPDPARRERDLQAASRRLADMETILNQLFAYTRACDPDATLASEPIALKPLVEHVLIGHYPEFEQRGWEPDVRFASDGVQVQADRDALTRILENLTTNALRHGMSAPIVRVTEPEGAARTSGPNRDGRNPQRLRRAGGGSTRSSAASRTARWAVRESEDCPSMEPPPALRSPHAPTMRQVSLTFANTVADPATINVERLFDRFYQVDEARSRGGSGSAGAGLGLATAAALARAMGMTLSASLDADTLTFDLRMPRLP